MLKNDYLDAKIGVDTAENAPFKSLGKPCLTMVAEWWPVVAACGGRLASRTCAAPFLLGTDLIL